MRLAFFVAFFRQRKLAQARVEPCLQQIRRIVMAGTYYNCRPNRVCKICGKPDWCSYTTFPNGDELEYCQRVDAVKGDSVSGIDGRIYVWKKETSEGFNVYEELSQYERNKAEFLKSNGKQGKRGHYRLKDADVASSSDVVVEDVAEVLPPEKLDRFYRTFLNLLKIEDKHAAKLKSEWGDNGLYESIVTTWGIRSIPPEDYVRYSSKERLKNLSRKKIMELLIEKCGEPKGVPGFYQKKDGRWTFYKLCGIAFPIFDSRGHIIRIRVNDDYPDVECTFEGREGLFRYGLTENEDGSRVAGWHFVPLVNGKYAYDEGELVWSYGSEGSRISLDKKGYPKGKVIGKYKNFSSYREKSYENDGISRVVNVYKNGCQSGSYCSLYCSKGDNFSIVYATEGEKKAMVANKLLHVPVVSIPGVSSFKKLFNKEECHDYSIMDILKKNGLSTVVLVYDADKNKNVQVLKAESKAVEEFKKNGIKIAIGEWNAGWGKGLDDILLTGVVPKIYMVA